VTDLTGRWLILDWVQHYDDGRVVRPLGERLVGFIQYGADGTMSCVIADADRKRLSAGQWNSPAQERADAYSRYLSYSGRYRIEGDTVVHEVEISLFPNWEGGRQVRRFRLSGDDLDLTARLEEGTSEARTAALRWRRDTSARA